MGCKKLPEHELKQCYTIRIPTGMLLKLRAAKVKIGPECVAFLKRKFKDILKKDSV